MSDWNELPSVQSVAGWSVGDRIWDEWNGTQVIHELRERALGASPWALVEAREQPGERNRMVLLKDIHIKLAPGDLDRPSLGPQSAKPGDVLRHAEFGAGMVLEPTVTEAGQPAVRIEFAPPFGVRQVELGGGQLRRVLWAPVGWDVEVNSDDK